MAQFDVHENANPASAARYPCLLDVQSDVLDPLATRVVVPLCARTDLGFEPVARLMPVLRLKGRDWVMVTPELAGIPARALGRRVASLAEARTEIVAALDLLLTGI